MTFKWWDRWAPPLLTWLPVRAPSAAVPQAT